MQPSMDEYEKELMKVLPGLNENLPQAFWRLAEVFRNQVFELCTVDRDGETLEYYVPYMMNDAVESYFKIEGCHMTGIYQAEENANIRGELITEKDGYALIVRQAQGNVFTLWFSDIRWEMHLYQYHTIGHFWRKGQEQWRQLVYMAGTLHDKYEYLGDEACSEKEKNLFHLIEFGPFRKWSPIHEDLEEKYPPTYEGIDCMCQMAREAGDWRFECMLRIYKKFPFRWLEAWLSQRLKKPAREALYQVIYEKIRQASCEYPARRYQKEEQYRVDEYRQEADAFLKRKGFQGAYPEYQKENIWIQAAEEQPFTILESSDYVFRIHFMISESRKGRCTRNSGFFQGRTRRGHVEEFKGPQLL